MNNEEISYVIRKRNRRKKIEKNEKNKQEAE